MFNITARGFKLREEIKTKVGKELQRVVKMLPENADFDVTVTFKHEEFKCDITVKHIGMFVRGEAVAKEVMPAVDFAVDDLKRKLRKLKTKLHDRNDLKNYNEMVANFDEEETEEDGKFALARVKDVNLFQMSDEEASLQLEMLGHNFFAYIDMDGNIAVLYKRKENDASYGKMILNQ